MSSSQRIQNAQKTIETGDVIKHFDSLQSIIQKNDGNHDFKTLASDCYGPNAPISLNTFTKFKITDQALDVINLDKGYLNLKVQYTFSLDSMLDPAVDLPNADVVNNYYVFVGFKSSSQIIDQYRVYSNGRKTSCEQTKAIYETMATRLAKSNEEVISRPGMYTTFEKAITFDDCVAGVYIKLADLITGPVTNTMD